LVDDALAKNGQSLPRLFLMVEYFSTVYCSIAL